jgi:hypothetical protein
MLHQLLQCLLQLKQLSTKSQQSRQQLMLQVQAIHMAQVDIVTKLIVMSKAPQINLRGLTFSTQEES